MGALLPKRVAMARQRSQRGWGPVDAGRGIMHRLRLPLVLPPILLLLGCCRGLAPQPGGRGEPAGRSAAAAPPLVPAGTATASQPAPGLPDRLAPPDRDRPQLDQAPQPPPGPARITETPTAPLSSALAQRASLLPGEAAVAAELVPRPAPRQLRRMLDRERLISRPGAQVGHGRAPPSTGSSPD
ncbi:MAG: hypothetical protein FJ125_11135 [Deltaproteobacteria bacterium]|nr:hypothetical protein [Deltaproteobacteria bacterium]